MVALSSMWTSLIPVGFVFQFLICSAHLKDAQDIRTKRSTTECARDALSNSSKEFFVFLTINAVESNSLFGGHDSRKIELNWTPKSGGESTDWIGLFRSDPEIRLREPLVRVPVTRHNGYYKTGYRFPQHPMLGLNSPMGTCLFGYWIGYIRGNETLKSNCLRMRPSWMWDEREVINDIPIHALMIPGSHNSGSYKILGEGSTFNILDRYSINQAEDVWNQLLYGIRYLDIRVGYYPHTPEKFWIVHNFVQVNPLYVVLQDVRKFLQSTKEILIVDFHRFPSGFQYDHINTKYWAILWLEIGWVATSLRGIYGNSNKTLILTYSHDPSSAYNDKIWSEVRHAWGDKKRPEALYRFLNRSMTRHQTAKYPWAAMTHLTPSALDVIMNPNGGIAQLSDGIARQINRWFREDWWNSANLVATDFILGNNIIEESILANRKRYICRQHSRMNDNPNFY
ncbi:uncharacterized protein LOC131883348 [Tigriopus californicus]|uniref:uncharacterized protein LOC131883348 n=1 Tax=Tigriopus californicus TaxID=6832 RepID=UPI0027D9D853|nr:uncharacterized protein LOC131883348 [Tigriopus californicus]